MRGVFSFDVGSSKLYLVTLLVMDERAFEGYRYDFQIIMVMLRDVSIHHFTSLYTQNIILIRKYRP